LTRIKFRRGAFGQNDAMKTVAEEMAAADLSGVKPANDLAAARLAREWATMSTMVRIYCRDRHQTGQGLCSQCRQFLDYAQVRLERCRFGQDKPTCAKCPVHCYQRARREEAKTIMRYAGPRMLWEHPILSLRHWLDGFREAPRAICLNQ
jgi:hypothetical protein